MATHPFSISTFTTSLISGEAPQPVQRDGRSIVLNYSLSIPEALFAISMNNAIIHQLAQGRTLIYLGITPQMQAGFEGWVDNFWAAKRLSIENKPSPEQLDIRVLIPSVWEKTKTYVENLMLFSGDQRAIDQDADCQREASAVLADIVQQGKSGRVFTEGQAHQLLVAVSQYMEELPRILTAAPAV